MYKISVIVPVYNKEKYISRTLDSLANQTLSDIEIICVDDGSTDNSLSVLKYYSNKYDNIKLISQKNKGLAGARNTGLKYSTSELIQFCDADDYYTDDMCLSMFNSINDNNSDIAACQIKVKYETNSEMMQSDSEYYRLMFDECTDNINLVLDNLDTSVCNKIFKASILKKYDIKFLEGYYYEDDNFFFKYLSVSNRISFVKQDMYIYTRYQNSIMNKTFMKTYYAIDHIRICNDVLDFIVKYKKLEQYHNEFVNMCTNGIEFSLRYCPKKYYPFLFYEANKLVRRLQKHTKLNSLLKSFLVKGILIKIFRKIKSIKVFHSL